MSKENTPENHSTLHNNHSEESESPRHNASHIILPESQGEPTQAKRAKLVSPSPLSVGNGEHSNVMAHASNQNGPSHDVKIDEGLYSRQLYVLGHEAMHRMAKSKILLSGLGPLGIEMAKNIALAGVGALTLQDNKKATLADLSAHFFLSEQDVAAGHNRATASRAHIAELNPYVKVEAHEGPLTRELIKEHDLLIVSNPGDQNSDPAWLFKMGDLVRELEKKLIVADTRGLFGQIFVDLGKEFVVFDKDGEQPLQVMVSNIEKSEQGVVTCLDETRHGFEDGDHIQFVEVKGLAGINEAPPRPIKVLGPYTFSIGDTRNFGGEYQSAGIARQVKQPVKHEFKKLSESHSEPTFCDTDLGKFDRPGKIHLAFFALRTFMGQFGRLPNPWNKSDAEEFLKIAQAQVSQLKLEGVLDANLLRLFSYLAAGQLSPLCSVIGGIAAQEGLKAVTGKFTPIKQWLYFDALECLPGYEHIEKALKSDEPIAPLFDAEQVAPLNSRYDSQIAVFGRDYQAKLSAQNVFIVGAGALGCELLKSMAMLGVGCKFAQSAQAIKGKVTVTDMDKIERSNLNRQFLFRAGDIGHAKSTVAANAARKMNPGLTCEPLELRVCPDTENIFDDGFFDSLDCVINALDNVEARIYMDRRCVYYRKPLLESGTMGSKCNVQVVVPHVSESYSATADPPEKGIMLCTLKYYPALIEHTIQWAREEFDSIFAKQSEFAARYLTEPDFIDRLLGVLTVGLQTLETLEYVRSALVTARCTTFKDCVRWARLLFEQHYNNAIRQLLFNFPADHKTSTGIPFWSPPKRLPRPLVFDPSQELHLQFIEATARIRAFMYNIPTPPVPRANDEHEKGAQRAELIRLLGEIEPTVPRFEPRAGVRIETNDAEMQAGASAGGAEDTFTRIQEIVRSLPSPDEARNAFKLQLVEFEKDDDTNYHIEFITAASNLRATNYGIETADRHKTKGIAGRIIPAIATTTAMVVGLVSLEFYKLAAGHKGIGLFRNAFVNLALPYFGFSEPVPPQVKKYNGIKWTPYDRFEVGDGQKELTLQELLDLFKNTHRLEITMMSQGQSLLFAFFMDQAKRKERLPLPISEVVRRVTQRPIQPYARALVLEVCCNSLDPNAETNDDGDVDVPYIRYALPRDAVGYRA